jgi:acid phosphatase (class A)
MQNKWLIGVGCTLFLLTACVSPPSNSLNHTYYDSTRHIFLTDSLLPPPPVGSLEDRKDLAAVLDAQKTRTQTQIKQVQLDANLTVFRFQPVLGEKFTPENFPVSSVFFEKLKQDENDVIQIAKEHYNRTRPYVASSKVKPVVPQPHNTSYPSGHSCFAWINAIFLAKMLPEKSSIIFGRALDYAHNRIIGGAHYPTDVEAGKISAFIIADEMMKDKQFMADFEKARQEIRSKLLK